MSWRVIAIMWVDALLTLDCSEPIIRHTFVSPSRPYTWHRVLSHSPTATAFLLWFVSGPAVVVAEGDEVRL